MKAHILPPPPPRSSKEREEEEEALKFRFGARWRWKKGDFGISFCLSPFPASLRSTLAQPRAAPRCSAPRVRSAKGGRREGGERERVLSSSSFLSSVVVRGGQCFGVCCCCGGGHSLACARKERFHILVVVELSQDVEEDELWQNSFGSFRVGLSNGKVGRRREEESTTNLTVEPE